MKKYLLVLIWLSGGMLKAQTNCNIYTDKPHQVACQYYTDAIQYAQGSKNSQQLFIYSLQACANFGPTLCEMSVPYLKRGDFYTWKMLMDKAVQADPGEYLSVRGWCYFKFLKDYKNCYTDLYRLYKLTKGLPGYTGDGDYDLRMVMAMTQRELGNNKLALHYFNECIGDHERKKVLGLYDYLHRGVTLLKMKRYAAALADLKLEVNKYPKLADAHYYIGLTYLAMHNKINAAKSLKYARELYLETGYHHADPYKEEPDQVYLSDITEAMAKAKS